MKREQFKKILKPLIKQCIRETLYEEGFLSTVISEVVQGFKKSENIVENKEAQQKQVFSSELKTIDKKSNKINEARQDLLEAIGKESYNGVNIFEDTQPLRSGGSMGPPAAPSSPLAGIDPDDSGVDISSIPGVRAWKKLI